MMQDIQPQPANTETKVTITRLTEWLRHHFPPSGIKMPAPFVVTKEMYDTISHKITELDPHGYNDIFGKYTAILENQKIFTAHTRPMAYAIGGMMAEVFKHTSQNESPHSPHFLEIGSGVGDTAALFQKGLIEAGVFEATITGIELSEASVEAANMLNKSEHINFIHDEVAALSRDKLMSELPDGTLDGVFGIFAPFNYAATKEQLEEMIHAVLRKLRHDGSAAFLFNTLDEKNAGKFVQEETGYKLHDERGVEFTALTDPKIAQESLPVQVTIFGQGESATFNNCLWSETTINAMLRDMNCDFEWVDDFDRHELPEYEQKKLNKLLIIKPQIKTKG